jgi:hypothetical protein
MPADPEGAGILEVGVAAPAPEAEGDGETIAGDVSFTAAASKRIILGSVVPLPYM